MLDGCVMSWCNVDTIRHSLPTDVPSKIFVLAKIAREVLGLET